MRNILYVLLCAIALPVATIGATGEVQNDVLAITVTRERLGSMLASYSRGPVDVRELRAWAERLSDKRLLQTDSSFDTSLQVRDVAVVVLNAITGSNFSALEQTKTTPVKEIVSWREKDTVWRFHIPVLTDEQFGQMMINVRFWIEGYEAGHTRNKEKGAVMVK